MSYSDNDDFQIDTDSWGGCFMSIASTVVLYLVVAAMAERIGGSGIDNVFLAFWVFCGGLILSRVFLGFIHTLSPKFHFYFSWALSLLPIFLIILDLSFLILLLKI